MAVLQIAEVVLAVVWIVVAILLIGDWLERRSLDTRLLGFLGFLGMLLGYKLAFLLPAGVAVYMIIFFQTFLSAYKKRVLTRDALDDLLRFGVVYWIVLFFMLAYRFFTLLMVGLGAMLVVLGISYRFAKVVGDQEA